MVVHPFSSLEGSSRSSTFLSSQDISAFLRSDNQARNRPKYRGLPGFEKPQAIKPRSLAFSLNAENITLSFGRNT